MAGGEELMHDLIKHFFHIGQKKSSALKILFFYIYCNFFGVLPFVTGDLFLLKILKNKKTFKSLTFSNVNIF